MKMTENKPLNFKYYLVKVRILNIKSVLNIVCCNVSQVGMLPD